MVGSMVAMMVEWMVVPKAVLMADEMAALKECSWVDR